MKTVPSITSTDYRSDCAHSPCVCVYIIHSQMNNYMQYRLGSLCQCSVCHGNKYTQHASSEDQSMAAKSVRVKNGHSVREVR